MKNNFLGQDIGAWRRNEEKRFKGAGSALLRAMRNLDDKDLKQGLETNAQSLGINPEEIVVEAYRQLQKSLQEGEIEREAVQIGLERLALTIDATPEDIIEVSQPKVEDKSETHRIS